MTRKSRIRDTIAVRGLCALLVCCSLLFAIALSAGVGVAFSAKVRCRGGAFELLEGGLWTRVFFKGYNLGAAPPGKFPGEFAATRAEYARWLNELSELGANAVRVYTIHTPLFYEAIAEHNSRPGSRPLWIFHGAWCDLPDDLDFYNASFSEEFRREIRNVVDVVHGAASLPERWGHASGKYSTDVSQWVAGYIIGREFEPFAVLKTDELHAGVSSFSGKFLKVDAGTPSECWMAGMCDVLVAYETEKYGQQHPVSFTNWPTLDPLTHPTEREPGGGKAYHDEDAACLDPSVVKKRGGFDAGFFATFHAYPYYPDFMNLDPGYNAFTDQHGPCNYAAYLADLKRSLGAMPLLIGEVGVPTSRGIAHFHPQGLNHGGASEEEQGRQNCRLLEDCYTAGTAGVMFFELIDEWFKDNWLVDDFEIPLDRDVLWQNVQDAEEFYGVLAEEPASHPGPGFVDWTAVKPLYEDAQNDMVYRSKDGFDGCRDLRELRVSSDSRFMYVRVKLADLDRRGDGRPDLEKLRLIIGFDTIDRSRGDFRFPLVPGVTTDCGNEFVIYVEGADSATVLIDSGYNYSRFSRVVSERGFDLCRWPFRPHANSDGVFAPLIVETNRERIDETGRLYPPIHLNTGKLVYTDETGPIGVSEGDWRTNVEEDYVEIRIPWPLLNITDPSSHMVLDDSTETREREVSRTDGIIVTVLSLTDDEKPRLSDAMPNVMSRGGEHTFVKDSLALFNWPGWETANYVERRKASFQIISSCISSVPDNPVPSVRVRVALWPDNLSGAASVSFDDGTASQIEYALPILEDFGLKASFGLCGAWTEAARKKVELKPGCVREQLSIADARKLLELGHEIAAHGYRHVFLDTLAPSALREELENAKSSLESSVGGRVSVFHYPFSRFNEEVVKEVEVAGFLGARAIGGLNEAVPNTFLLKSVAVVSDTAPGPKRFQELLSRTKEKRGWLILMYHHVLPERSAEARCYRDLDPDEPYYVTPSVFRSQMQLVAGSQLYVAPEGQVLTYVKARESVSLDVNEMGGTVTIKVNAPDAEIDSRVLLTLIVELPWKKVRVSSALEDSVREVAGGILTIKAHPGSEISVYRME